MTPESIFFYGFSLITVVTVILMIVQRNPVSSALCLVASFFSLAALYVLLQAHFVATLQILVYAGAIMVLFIFVIMLLNLREDELSVDRFTISRLSVIFFAILTAGVLGFKFLSIPVQNFKEVTTEFGTAKSVGALIFQNYIVPFEIMGLMLLVGIVGAILLGRQSHD